jgi:membrane protein implicated in regulation of membrane protease activity
MLPTPATSLVLLTLLALGTFLAGVSLLSLQIAFLGLAMGAAVPAISWLQQSVIFFLLGAVLLVGLGLTFWFRQDRRPESTGISNNNQMES